ncbi:MAG: hypothetical protein ABI165_07470 [Bryobacteraceae bacterium]
MKKALVFLLAIPMFAAAPTGYVYWSAADQAGIQKKFTGQKLATDPLGNYGNHLAMVAHREASGEAEVHRDWVDIMIVETGSATVQVGGEAVNGKTTAPGEIRGSSITGGIRQKVGPGDILRIPANTPHRVLVQPGQQITYFMVKVAAK